MSEKLRKQDLVKLLNRETSKIAWNEMAKHFAGGNVIQVDKQLDLIDTAAEIALDNATMLDGWMQQALVAPVTDEKAAQWFEENTTVWAVVIAPYVLVQEVQ